MPSPAPAHRASMTGPAHARQALDSLPHIVWTAGPDGTVEYVNRRAAEYFGVPVDDLLGWDWGWVVHPHDLPRMLTACAEAVRTGQAGEAEYRLRRHDGEYLWFRSRAEPVRDAEGRVAWWCGTCTNVDESKRGAEQLRAARPPFRALVERSPDGLVLVGADGTVLYANPAAACLLGFAANDLAGTDLWGSVAEEDRSPLCRWWEGVLARPGERSSIAVRFVTRGQVPLALRVTANNLLPDPDVRGVAVQLVESGGS